jgi:AAA+ superfamily predicted ATPase
VHDALLDSLRRAVESAPDDLALRLHLAELLIQRGSATEALSHLGVVLQQEPDSAEARALLAAALAGASGEDDVAREGAMPTAESLEPGRDETQQGEDQAASTQATAEPGPDRAVPNGESASGPDRALPGREGAAPDFDWSRAEGEFSDVVPPMFVDGDVDGDDGSVPAYDVERSTVTLADVGGMEEVKARLEAAFLAPMRNPELKRLYGKSLRGGLLLYGPPGCGKTFIARALAGELGAQFVSVSLADILEMWIGQSERNLHDVFELARRNAPCVLFLDEIDALGQKRSLLRNSAMRSTVNQLLAELDGVSADNEGVFVLAATNAPWDVDPAMRRPGRLDRMLLVLPPDQPARAAILRHHLRDRPIARIDVNKLAKRTDGFSGADLAHVCEVGAERALLDSARTGTTRLIEMADLDAAISEIKPSIRPWLESARNVALFANEGGQYDELLAYLKRRKLA